jgi:ABC-type nitrate/sulfonate/bicarbonate transport system permease component
MSLRTLLASVLGILAWLAVKYLFDISDRYMPGPAAVLQAIQDLGTGLLQHTASTLVRVIVGFAAGTTLGIALALLAFRQRWFDLLLPTVHAVRAVPAVALVPFFLLWFGFSEIGRYLLVVVGLGLNVMVACADVLQRPALADRVLFHNFGATLESRVLQYWLPRVVESLLPTLRFGIALTIGLIVVSEMLGSQVGLGYVIQTSRATFSLNVIFVCTVLLGCIAAGLDLALRMLWNTLVRWR